MEVEVEGILQRVFPGALVHDWEPLFGGVSANAISVELELPTGDRRRIVVRRPGCPTIEEGRRVARYEYRVLALCKSANITVPTPCFLDEEKAALVLEYIEGTVDFAPRDSSSLLRQMAAQLARIHQVCIGADFDFLPRLSDSLARSLAGQPEQLDLALDEPYLRSVLRELWPWPSNRDRLLHGDYWPGNLLWRDQRLAAVIDWEESTLGDPLADVATTRLDLWWAFGESAMHAFTE